jgi:hypothetical protein
MGTITTPQRATLAVRRKLSTSLRLAKQCNPPARLTQREAPMAEPCGAAPC